MYVPRKSWISCRTLCTHDYEYFYVKLHIVWSKTLWKRTWMHYWPLSLKTDHRHCKKVYAIACRAICNFHIFLQKYKSLYSKNINTKPLNIPNKMDCNWLNVKWREDQHCFIGKPNLFHVIILITIKIYNLHCSKHAYAVI